MFVFNFWEYKREKILTSCLQYILKIGGGCFSVLAKQFEGKHHTLSSSFWCESKFFYLYSLHNNDIGCKPGATKHGQPVLHSWRAQLPPTELWQPQQWGETVLWFLYGQS